MADVGLNPADIDGAATTDETPVTITYYLGIPKWVDGTAVGGCSFMIHIRHAAAAIASGLCETVLITHGASGRYASPRWATTCAALRIGDNTAESREFIADLARLESRQPPRPGRS